MSNRHEAPEGWYYEEGDPSVGIFGHCWVHDACSGTTEYGTEEELLEEVVEGESLIQTRRVGCLDCGATFLSTEYDWIGPAEEPEETDYES